jgi:hypothetical protein
MVEVLACIVQRPAFESKVQGFGFRGSGLAPRRTGVGSRVGGFLTFAGGEKEAVGR